MKSPTNPLGNRSIAVTMLVVASMGLGGMVRGQEHLHTQYGGPGQTAFEWGGTVDGGEDVNGDGRLDVITSAQDFGDLGMVRIHDGLDGSLIREHVGQQSGDNLGFRLGLLGDLDGDGCSEYGLTRGAIFSSSYVAEIRSGIDGTILSTHPLGPHRAIERLPDLDGDQRPETLLGRTIHSLALGAVIGTVPASLLNVAPGGDVDGDGRLDLCGRKVNGAVVAWSIFSSTEILNFNPPGGPDSYVRGIGDVNGDGKSDIAVRKQFQDCWVHSGATGAPLFVVRAKFGVETVLNDRSIYPFGDLNGDCAADFLLRTRGGAKMISGASGRELRQYTHPSIPYCMSVANAGDLDQDGFDDVVMGCNHTFVPGVSTGGSMAVFRTLGPPGDRYCSSNPNSTGKAARVTFWGSLSVAENDLSLRAGPIPDGTPGWFFYGSTPIQQTFGDGYLCIGRGASGLVRLSMDQANFRGCLRSDIDLASLPPHSPWAAGTTWNVQAWFPDPAAGGSGFNLSDAMTLTFTP